MLLTDKKNRSYAFVELNDILSSLESANELDRKQLIKLYNSQNYEDDKIRISKRSKVYHILKNSNIIDGDTYINPTMLAESYARASYEFNYDMKDRLFKYFKRYLDNMRAKESNEKLVQKILCDEKTMEYIHRYDSIADYTKHIIGTRIKANENKKEEVKSRSFVKAA